MAAMKNFEHSTKLLLENKADPTLKTNIKKATPLHLAVVTNALGAVRVLMQYDKKPLWQEQDLLQQTPLSLGQRFKRDPRIVELLQQKGIYYRCRLFLFHCFLSTLSVLSFIDLLHSLILLNASLNHLSHSLITLSGYGATLRAMQEIGSVPRGETSYPLASFRERGRWRLRRRHPASRCHQSSELRVRQVPSRAQEQPGCSQSQGRDSRRDRKTP